jgi:two-component system sensor histidine kinase FlrB
MLPTSHPVPINPSNAAAESQAGSLLNAFSHFTAAAGQLEQSYQELRKEVTQLRAVLAERNRDLHESLAENARVRTALQQIVDALPCGVVVTDQRERVKLINPEARRLLEVTNQRIETLRELPLAAELPLGSLVKTTAEDWECELRVSTWSGERLLAVRSRKFAVPSGFSPNSSEGDPCGQQTVLIVRDITSQRRLEDDREKSRNLVALAEMAALLAHEIRNPLASLELFISLIEEAPGGATEYISHLRAGIRSLSATVNNVLQFHGVGTLPLAPLKLGEILRGAVEFVRPLAGQKQIQLSFADYLDGMIVRANESAIQQLVLNLALNSFRHTAAGGSLRITASRVHADDRLLAKTEFVDNGCGIASNLLSRLFEPGFSGTGQTPGLGLAVCRRLVEQQGGTMEIRSEPGKGTAAEVLLPAAL